MPRPNSPQLWKPKNLIFPISEYLKYWCKPINLQGAQVGWDMIFLAQFSIVQLLSCNPMDHSMPDLPVHHQLLEFTQTHLHWVGDAIQPSHPLSFPSPPALYLSQHQGFFQMSQLFTSGGQSIGASASASVLPMNIHDWFPLGLTGCISLQSKGLSRVFSSTTVWRHHFFGAQPFLLSSSHICTWLLEKP